ncbi:MAG: TM1266 family iron-only hydrogenase system putative regulator [Lentisphaerota bacterium]
MDKRLGFVGIMIEDRLKAARLVNEILSDFGELIVGRMGLPYGARHCNIITLIVDATTDELGVLTGKLGALEGVSVKSALSKPAKSD